MSGGVDSSVTAALLSAKGGSASGGKERGFDVRGIHIKMWSDPDIPCNFKEDRYDAMRVAAKLDIPFETWDFTKEYKSEVVEYMIREYAVGRTPNPDVMCNRHIKFGVFLKRALRQGADFVATGHYVLKVQSPKSKVQSLLKAKDGNKDQSYFLWTLTQEQLKHCLFPIGEYMKPEVRILAKKFGLPTAEKEESQGICFIGEINIREFLKKYIPEKRGAVVTASGKIVGEHEGLSFYTMGQREGLGIGGGIPYYVAAKDFDNNKLIVGEGPYDKNLFAPEAVATDVNWISGKTPQLPLECEARIRYRQPLQRASIKYQVSSIKGENRPIIHNTKYLIRFAEPQRAVTPGQSVVFYQGGEMLGGGIIV